ncbi:MAG: hypothetical protein ACYCWC_07780 [Rhodocyclaceae bacterium]
MQNPTSTTSVDACRRLFGEHPEDVIAPINCAADALAWLEEILKTISRDTLVAGNGYRIKLLADAGAYLALEIGNFAGCQHETMIKRLYDAGVVPKEACHDLGAAAGTPPADDRMA